MRLSTYCGNLLYAALGVVGMAAWMLFILACLPTVAWSPDGTKILFAYQRPDPDEAGVGLYDRTTGATRRLFVSSDPDSIVLADWTRDGKQAIVYEVIEDSCCKETLTILLQPVLSEEPARLLFVGENEASFELLPPQRDGDLFLGGQWLMRLDLASGEVEEQRDLGDGIAILTAGKDRLFYIGRETESKWEQAHGSQKPAGDEESWVIEIGELEPEQLTLQPLFELSQSQIEPFGVEDVYGGIWVDPSETRFALLGDGDEHSAIVLCGLTGFERVVTPQIPFDSYRLGIPQWSPDGKTLYAGIATPSDDEGWLQFSLVEIPLEGGPGRLVPIVRLRGDPEDLEGDDGLMPLPTIALSPDGSTIAAAATLSDDPDSDLAPERLALFLVNLRDPQRPVREILPAFLRLSAEAD